MKVNMTAHVMPFIFPHCVIHVLVIDDTMEDGETSSEPSLDVNRIVEYPGFTLQTPEGIIDVRFKHVFSLFETSRFTNIYTLKLATCIC